jgi:hypothetical protein
VLKQQTFDLADDAGVTHHYMVIQHPGGEALELAAHIAGLGRGVGGVLEGLKPLIATALAEGGADAQVDITAFSGTALGEALRDVGAAVLAAGGVELATRLLKYTARDGTKLDTRVPIDAAFQGNLGELLEAMYLVAKANFEGAFKRPLARVGLLSRSPGS